MAYNRPKSLRDLRVHAKLKPALKKMSLSVNLNLVGEPGVTLCKIILGTQTVKSSSGAVVKLKCDTNCKTVNVVFLISSCKCQKLYVGETKGPLNLRMNCHRDDWKHCRFERSPVAEHFRSTEHDFLKHASVCCINHSSEWTDSNRKSRESYWIRRLNTLKASRYQKE